MGSVSHYSERCAPYGLLFIYGLDQIGDFKMRAAWILMALWMMASTGWAAGRVEGRVGQRSAQTYLDGAAVRIPALRLETATRSDGRFSFPNVPTGTHHLEVRYIGYQAYRQQITVAEGQVAQVPVTLTNTIEEIVVYGQASSTASALNQQRSSDSITSIVSSDEFGQLPDANLSEALQRIPGVFLERDQGEGRFVGVRGIDPNLNVTSINGVALTSPENNTRAVALDIIPTELLENIEVRKSFTPDMDPNGIGGSINVKSLSAFDRKGRFYKMKAEGGYNELEEKMSPRVSGVFSDTFNLGEGNDNFGVALAVSWFDRKFGSDNVMTDGGWPADLETTANEEFKGAEEVEYRNHEVNRERLGTALNLDFRPNDNAQYYIRTLYSKFSDQEYRTREEFKLDKGDAIAATATSATWDDAELHRELKDRFEKQEILSATAGGTSWFNQWTADYRYGYSKSLEKEPNRTDSEFEIEGLQIGYSDIGRTPALFTDPLTLDPDNYELSEITVEDNDTEDEQHSLQFDLQREFDSRNFTGFVKAGVKVSRREKSNDAQIVVYDGFPGDPSLTPFVGDSPDYGEGDFGPGISKSAMSTFIADNRALFDIDDDDSLAGSLGGDYEMGEDVNAAYAMSRVDSGKLRMVFGLRYEETDFEAKGQRILFDDVSGNGDPVLQPVTFSDSYSSFLPSINLRYAFSDDLILRAAWYESFARPSFGDLSPGGEIEFETDNGESELKAETGNPLLHPLEATNLDISLEHYDSGIGVLSAGVFYKKLENFIVSANVAASTDLTQFVGDAAVDTAEVLQPINGDNADLLGFEAAWVKQFIHLPAPWNGLMLSANATFTDSEAHLALRPGSIDLPRQSDMVVNFMLGYENERFSARVATTYKSDALLRLEEPDDPAFDVYQDAHVQLDLSIKYNINNNWQVYFEGNNLTNEPFYAYFDSRRFNATYETYGRSYALGVQYRAQ